MMMMMMMNDDDDELVLCRNCPKRRWNETVIYNAKKALKHSI